jgi:superfamily II DNA or RNA helicase
MIFRLSEDNRWLQLTDYKDILEFRQVQISFTKKIKNYWLYKKKGWDGEVRFFYKDRFLPVGLWGELMRMGKEHKLDVEIQGIERLFEDITFDDFKEWADEFFEGSDRQPREYQLDAAYKILKYRLSVQELATNSGKTLIVFMVIAYMLEKGLMRKFLMIVPNANLVMQAVDDFQEYEKHRKEKTGIVTQMVYSGAEMPRKEANVVIGTFQSLVKREEDFLSQFDVVFCDECHTANAMSIKKILAKTANAKWKFGLTGTLGDPEFADYYTIQASLGPMVKVVSADFLFQNDFATPVDVRVVRMKYLSDESCQTLAQLKKQAGEDPIKVYNLERKMVVDSRVRLNFVCDFIARSSKNSLVLFQSVEEGYGKQIYDRLREITNDREVFYIDGEVSTKHREEYKERMKTGTNRILVASLKTFSTGISINNIHNIFFTESYKAEKVIRQSIGRGMRKHEDKEVVKIIDFVDDFSYKGKPNHMMKHSNERIKIYEQQKFPYKVYEVNLLSHKPVF